MADGRRTCWGNNAEGQAPDGYSQRRGTETLQIVAGGFHSCALFQGQPIKCWGSDSWNQSSAPGFDDFVQISAGAFHTCGVRENGRVVCWGDDMEGQSSPP
jgi:alpha-tubulin suppressor-like RCC1 family protein